MGSYNLKCSVSNNPITSGDKVKLFFIVSNNSINIDDPITHQHTFLGYGIYPWDHFSILGFGFNAEYDDSGVFDWDENDPLYKYNLEIIKKNYTSTTAPSSYYDKTDGYDLTPDELDIESICTAINNGIMFLDSSHDKSLRRYVNFFAVLDTVYNTVLDSTVFEATGFSKTDTLKQYKKFRKDNVKNRELELEKAIDDKISKNNEMIGDLKDNYITTGAWILEKAALFAELSPSVRTQSDDRTTIYSYTNSLGTAKITKSKVLEPLSTEERFDLRYEQDFFVSYLGNRNINILPTQSTGQHINTVENCIENINIYTQVLKSVQDSEMNVMNFKVNNPSISIKLSDVQKYADHCTWEKTKATKISNAVQKYISLYGTETVKLDYSTAKKNRLDELYFFLGTHNIDIEIINDM